MKNSFLTSIKNFALKFISPIRTSKQIHFVLNIIWLVIAVVSFILGIILGFKSEFFKSEELPFILNVWCRLSLICMIPFLFRIIKIWIKDIRKGISAGKKIQYTETTVSEVGYVGSDIYEISKEKRNAGGILGFVWAIVSLLFYMVAFIFVGVIALIARFVLTIKEIIKYSLQKAMDSLA